MADEEEKDTGGLWDALQKLAADRPPGWPEGEVEILGLRLELTCGACPEQYDVFDQDGRQVAYFRLRHGMFTAECPDCGGEYVYFTSQCRGDGQFAAEEREMFLTRAVRSVLGWMLRQQAAN